MPETPLVSVIIPTYNRAHLLGDAIQSALSQTYPNKEILVVDDGSSDHTEECVRGFPEVRYIQQEHGGQAKARNTGLQHARGEYIASLDSDDEWYSGFLEKNVSKLEQEQLDFVFSNWMQESKAGELIDFYSRSKLLCSYLHLADQSWVTLEYEQVRHLFIQSCAAPSSALVMRRSSIASGWNERMNIGDDWCIILDMIFSRRIRAAFTMERLWVKRVDSNNIYDGRHPLEIHKLLWIDDRRTLFVRHKAHLTTAEIKLIRRRDHERMLHSAAQSLRSDVKNTVVFLKDAFRIDPRLTVQLGSTLLAQAGIKRIRKIGQLISRL